MKSKTSIVKENNIVVPRFKEDAGFYTSTTRSKMMAKIRSKNSKAELLLRCALWAQHLRYRLHPANVPGKPDIFIMRYKLAIFVDGDFWHGYQWDKRKPKTNQAFWIPKIERNMQRDKQVNAELEQLGFTVMRFWEHEIKTNLQACVNQVLLYLEAAKKIRDSRKGVLIKSVT